MATASEPPAKRPREMSLYEKMTQSGRPLLFDGEVGGGLRKRLSNDVSTKLTPASILLDAPHHVRELHLEYINSGSQIITTNTYAAVRQRMKELLGMGERWEEAVDTACAMAKEAREKSGKDVLIAGTLPPLHGSYKPAGVGEMERIVPVYEEHVARMESHVDVFICETMSTAKEAWAAASAAKKSRRPVWVSWCIKDDCSGLLRSGETLQQAWEVLAPLAPEGVFVNCCSPESITAALPHLAKMGPKIYGGWGNGFSAIPENWRVEQGGIAALGKRRDLTPEVYTKQAEGWLKAGAFAIGGCCEVGPEYIASMRKMMDDLESEKETHSTSGDNPPPSG